MAAPALRADPLHIERRAAHGKEAVVAVPRIVSCPEDLKGEDIRTGQQELFARDLVTIPDLVVTLAGTGLYKDAVAKELIAAVC